MAGRAPTAPGWPAGEARPGMPPWVPNAISILRIALVPVCLALAFAARDRALAGQEASALPLLTALVLLGLSDIVDGTIARHYRLTSNLGATLDAVADKLAQIALVTFLAWLAEPVFTPLPLWLWGGLLVRDLLLGVGWLAVWTRHRVVRVEHRWHGKAVSTLLFALIAVAVAGAPAAPILFGSAVAVGLMIAGTAAYLFDGWQQLVARRG